jgi:co-chaperonin GroES (HSP10)
MLKPIGARVVVKRLELPKPESSLIVIPESVSDKPSPYALVLAVGQLQSGGFDVGDTVILSDYAGVNCVMVLDGESIPAIIVPEGDVLAVVVDQ